MTRRAPAGRERSPRWRWLSLVLQLLVAAGLLGFAFVLFDVEQVRLAFRRVSVPSLLGFVVLMMATRAVGAWRWKIVAHDHFDMKQVSTVFLFRVGLLAEFANLWLQSFIGGEAVRMWKVGQRVGDAKAAVGSVALDRVVGTVGLLVACLPFLVTLGVSMPSVSVPPGAWRPAAAIAALLALGTVVVFSTVPAARVLLRRSLDFLRRQKLPLAPFLVSLLIYPLIVLAHRVGFPELGGGSWLAIATVALVPRLGRAVPLSVFGITAVEGSVFVVGALLGIENETLVLVVALNLFTKYVASGLGAVAELAVDGRRSFSEMRRSAEADEASMLGDHP